MLAPPTGVTPVTLVPEDCVGVGTTAAGVVAEGVGAGVVGDALGVGDQLGVGDPLGVVGVAVGVGVGEAHPGTAAWLTWAGEMVAA